MYRQLAAFDTARRRVRTARARIGATPTARPRPRDARALASRRARTTAREATTGRIEEDFEIFEIDDPSRPRRSSVRVLCAEFAV